MKVEAWTKLFRLQFPLTLLRTAGSDSRRKSKFRTRNLQKEKWLNKTRALEYRSPTGRTIPYRLFLPADYDPDRKYPLVLALHGVLSRGHDNQRQLKPFVAGWTEEAFQQKHPCLILMPQCPKGMTWVDGKWNKVNSFDKNGEPNQSLQRIKAIVDKTMADYSVDPARVYVIGASMGAFGTCHFAGHYPELVAAVLPVCGGGPPSLARFMIDIPIWAIHGRKDILIPPSHSKRLIEAIIQAGGTKAKLTLVPLNHAVYQWVWKQPAIHRWIFNQRKVPQPDAVGTEKTP